MTEQRDRRAPAGNDPAPRLLRVDGIPWLVYEHTPAYDRRARPTLVFESEDLVRRVHEFPSDWRELGDEALYALSWNK